MNNQSAINVYANPIELRLTSGTGDNYTTAVSGIFVTSSLPFDAYEPDNSETSASTISAGMTQYRTLHSSDDIDWIEVNFALGDNLVFSSTKSFELWGYSPDVVPPRVPGQPICGMFKISESSVQHNLDIRQPLPSVGNEAEYCYKNFSKLYMKFQGVKENYSVQYFRSNTPTVLQGFSLSIDGADYSGGVAGSYLVTVHAENMYFHYPYDMFWTITKNGVEVVHWRVSAWDLEDGLAQTGLGIYQSKLRVCYYNGACVTTQSPTISLP